MNGKLIERQSGRATKAGSVIHFSSLPVGECVYA